MGGNKEIVRKFSHDVRGPLSNISKLVEELEGAKSQLNQLLLEFETELPPAFVARTHATIQQDFDPLLDCVEKCAKQMTQRLQAAIDAMNQA